MNKPVINTSIIKTAIAKNLAALFPPLANNIFASPRTNTPLPAFYINSIPRSGVDQDFDNRFFLKRGFDVVYIEQYNTLNLYDHYTDVADILDVNFKFISFVVDEETYLLRTLERNWTVDLAAMHYRFNLDLRTSLELPEQIKMRIIEELNEEVTEGSIYDG